MSDVRAIWHIASWLNMTAECLPYRTRRGKRPLSAPGSTFYACTAFLARESRIAQRIAENRAKTTAMGIPFRDVIRIIITLFWPLLYGAVAIAVVTTLFALLGHSD